MVRSVTDIIARRRAQAGKAWLMAMDRLCARAGSAYPVGLDTLSNPELLKAEKEADLATTAYINGDSKASPRDNLAKWEQLMGKAIDEALSKRGCSLCGVEKVVEIVDPDGNRSCGRCRSAGPASHV